MRMKGATAIIPQLLLGLALLAALCWNLVAHAAEVKNVRVDNGATGTRAELVLDQKVEYTVINLQNPDRLVIDFPDTKLSAKAKLPANEIGHVKAVRRGEPVPGTTRIVFDLSGKAAALKPRIEQLGTDTRLVIEWPGDSPTSSRPPSDAIVVNEKASASAIQPADVKTASQTETVPAPDQAKSSADATSRLIKELAQRTEQENKAAAAAATPVPAPTPAVVSTPPSAPVPVTADAQTPVTAPISNAPSTTPAANGQTRVATGVPTRIATGVPTTVTAGNQHPGTATTTNPNDILNSATVNTPPVEPETLPPPVTPVIPKRAGSMRPLIVAIDPGHGGQDPGAIGPTGKREKDVTLAVSRELARQINATPGLKAYLTRDVDVFIPLGKRAQLARAAKADIFISIHADAAENRSAKGSSVYVLSTKGASSQRARWLADKENAADLIGGRMPKSDNTLASVLLDLTQSGHMKASEDAAGHVMSGLATLGNSRNRIERANFAVLRTSDMPAMLVETAFISNHEEERLLIDPGYQRRLATSVLRGIDAYFTRQPPPGTLYAARAAAAQSDSASQTSGGSK